MTSPNVELAGINATMICSQHLIVRADGCIVRGIAFMHGILGCVSVVGSGVIVRDVAFVNCSSPTNGGALNVLAASILLDRVIVMGSSAVFNGGGVYVVGTATVVDSNFRNNSAGVNGGAFWLRGGTARMGGATVFKYNNAQNFGGAIYVQDRGLIITDDTLCDSNHAVISGGCTMATTNVTISGRAVIQGNSAGEPFGSGGGVQTTTTGFYLIVDGLVVVRRNQAYTGGGLYMRNFIMRGSVLVEENLAVQGSGLATIGRGIIDIRDRCIFRRNRAVSFEEGTLSSGAAISSGVQTTVLIGGNVIFDSNIADQGSALTVVSRSTLRIDGNVQFINNVASIEGGAMYVVATSSALRNTMVLAGSVLLRNNSAGTYGGGLVAQLSAVTITGDVRLEGNSALFGGGVFASQCVHQFTGRVSFVNNSATLRGGAVMITTVTKTGLYSASTAVISDDVVFSDNCAREGGAICSEDSTLNIAGRVAFRNNAATNAGAMLLVLGEHTSVVTVRGNVVFFNNSAVDSGGAVTMNGTLWTAECCMRMEANLANGNGGAMVLAGESQITLTSASIVANRAHKKGGGILASDTAQLRLNNCTVMHNVAGTSGGGLQGTGYARINTTRSTRVQANQAVLGGGAAVAGYAMLTIADDTVFSNNTAAEDGGGVFSSSTVVMGPDARVRGCFAARGGGLFSNGAVLTLDGMIENNHAAQDGGGVFLYGQASVSGVVRGNSAVGLGGGLFASGSDARLSFAYGTLVDGNMAGSGGGLYLEEAAAMQVSKEACGCSGRNNGECDLDCMTRACNWDDGECSALLVAPPQTCNRLTCTLYSQTDMKFRGCDDGCFSASCDWSRVHCSDRKAQLAACPLFDLSAYGAQTGSLYAITTRGPRRCISQECARYPEFRLNGVLDTSQSWVMVPWTDELDVVRTDATLAFWLRGWDRGGLFWSPNLELMMTDSSLELRFQNRSKPAGYGLYTNCSITWAVQPTAQYEMRMTFKDGLIQLYMNGTRKARTGGSCPVLFQWVFDGAVLDLNLNAPIYTNSLVAQDGLAIGRSGGRVLIDGFAVWDRVELEAPCRQALLCYDAFTRGVIADYGTGTASVGYAISNSGAQCTLSDDGGQGWCIGPRPNLPSLNLGYDPADLPVLNGLIDGCARLGVLFRGNQAQGYGGAVFQSGCNKGLDGHGVCFFTGMSTDFGAVQIVFEHNRAGTGGGAVYTDCDVLLPICTKMRTLTLGLPSQPARVRFANNTVLGYGPDIATAPSQLVMPSTNGLIGSGPTRVPIPTVLPRPNITTLAYVPGQQIVDLSLVLLDGLGTVVSGDDLSFVFTILLCPTESCSLQTAMHLPYFVTLDRNIAHSSSAGVNIVCPGANGTQVFAFLYLSGTTSPYLQRTVRLGCLDCQKGQQRSRDAATWWCTSCQATQYVIDPNRHSCHKCAQGAKCDGSGLVGLDGSEWEILNDVYRLRSCPVGYVLIRDESDCVTISNGQECKTGPELDHCYKCPGSPAPGRFTRLAAFYPGPQVSATEATVTSTQCRPCPKGANCELGGDSIIPLAGYWSPKSNRRAAEEPIMYKCLPDLCTGGDQCLEGHTGFVCGVCQENYTHSGTNCVQCASEESLRAGRAAGLTILIIAFVAAWYFVSIRPFLQFMHPTPASEDVAEGGLKSKLQELSTQLKASQLPVVMGILKILLTFYQVTSCFWTAFDVPWPQSLNLFFHGSTVTKGDIFTISSFACLTRDWSRGDRLLFYTVTPPAITFLLGLPFAAAHSISHSDSAEYRALRAKFINATLVFLFLVYPMCSIAILDIYNCSRIEKMYWLTNDLRMACPMFEKVGFLFVWTVVCTVLFPLGIPLLMVWGLFYFQVPQMAREKTEREALNAMLGKFQDDHKQSILDASNADVSFCALILNTIDRRNQTEDGVWMHFRAHGKVTLEVFTAVLLEVYSELRLDYAEDVLRTDIQAIFKHFDVDSNGELAKKEFAILTCALVESWHEDLTAAQIDALVHHKWANRMQSESWLSRIIPSPPIGPRTKLLRHCAFLVKEQILSVGKSYWNELPSAPEREKLALECVGFLFLSYRVEHWYFELIEQLRKLLMTSIIVVFYPGSLAQLVGGIFVTFMGLVLCFVMKPYMQPQLNELQATCLSVQGITLFYGIILIADNGSNANSAPTTTITQIILAINIGLVFVPFLQFFFLRPPPFGERALWERIVDAVFKPNAEPLVVPRRRRSSVATTELSYYKPNMLTGAA